MFKRIIRHIGLVIIGWPIFHYLNDLSYIKIKYLIYYGKNLNIDNPKTYNEKIQWLKLFDRDPKYPKLVDKAEVKEYIAETIGKEHVIPTYGVWDSFSKIDFSSLPDSFVMKCTHDSSSVIICSNKREFDYEYAKKRMAKGLKKNQFIAGREWAYKGLKPRIIVEERLPDPNDGSSSSLMDYKFFCFNGHVKCFKVDFDRFVNHKANYYSPDGSFLPFEETFCPSDKNKHIVFPSNLNAMIKTAETLSKGIPFVRVDLYNVNGKIYFGEMTFYPASGFGFINPEKWDYTLGEWIVLPTAKKG